MSPGDVPGTSGRGGTWDAAAGAGGFGGGAALGGSGGASGSAGFLSDAGLGGVDGGWAGTGGTSAGIGGVDGGAENVAGPVLNPWGCETPNPFVLAIDPGGTSGWVRGWLESAPGLVFEDQLPRFARTVMAALADDAVGLWWSINNVINGHGQLYFYGREFTGTPTEVAVAEGATSFQDIDVDALDYTGAAVAAETGSFVVCRNTSTGEVIALHVEQVAITDPAEGNSCAAVDANWRFLR